MSEPYSVPTQPESELTRPEPQAPMLQNKKRRLNPSDFSDLVGKTIHLQHTKKRLEDRPIHYEYIGFSPPENLTLDFQYQDCDHIPGQPKRILRCSKHPKVDYVATIRDNVLFQCYKGIFNPTENRLELIPARYAEVMVHAKRGVEVSADNPEFDTEQQRAARRLLNTEFGNKKSNRQIERRKANTVKTKGAADADETQTYDWKKDATANALMQQIEEYSKSMPTEEERKALLNKGYPRPEPNLETDNIAEIYLPETLIGRDIFRLVPIQDWIDSVRSTGEAWSSSRFVVSRIKRNIPHDDDNEDEDASQKRTTLSCLKFMSMLLDFLAAMKAPASGKRALPPPTKLKAAMQVHEDILKSIKSRFSTGSVMTQWHFDYLCTHLAALSLVVDGGRSMIEDLQNDLGLSSKQCDNYFKMIGAVVVSTQERLTDAYLPGGNASTHRYAKLTCPLKLPETRLRRKRLNR